MLFCKNVNKGAQCNGFGRLKLLINKGFWVIKKMRLYHNCNFRKISLHYKKELANVVMNMGGANNI